VKLQYNGQEVIPAGIAEVWAFIVDPAKVASCLPDIQSYTVRDAQHVDTVVRVGVGPVRGNFKLKLAMEPDQANNRMNVVIGGGGLGSAVDLTAGATLVDNGDGTTTLDWEGTATMRGPVAAVGGRILDAQAKKMITQTFANVKTGVVGGTASPA
jgi:carbon monoxide dehydrogenase subunit G